MKKGISVNLDEGIIEAFDGLQCEPLLQKIRVCRDCGKIHFLPPEQTGLCKDHKVRPLEEELQDKKTKIRQEIEKRQMTRLFTSLLSMVIIGALFLVIQAYPFRTELVLWCQRIIFCCLFVMLVFLLWQVVIVYRSSQERISKDGFTALVIRDFTPDKPEYQGQSWEKMILAAYAYQTGYLENWAKAINPDDAGRQEAWNILYTNAMELSYMNDCEQLALLRLVCLDRVALLPQTYTDIRQIMAVVSDEVLYNWLDTVVKCLESLCVPCDEGAVRRFMDLADYSIRKTEETGGETAPVIQCIKRGFSALGPYYVLRHSDHYPKLSSVIRDMIQRDLLYRTAYQRASGQGV